MLSDDVSSYTPSIESAIDRQPLVVTLDTSLSDVVTLMSQTRGFSCSLRPEEASDNLVTQEARASCVLVLEGPKVIGILTERDIVRMTAMGLRLDNTAISDVMAYPVITLPEKKFQDIFAALFLFRRYKIRHLVIVDEQNQLVGTVSPASIRHVLRPTNLLKLRRVTEVMHPNVIYAPPSVTVKSLTQQMTAHSVSCVIIVEEDEFSELDEPILLPVGIVTERDVVQFQALGLDLSRTRAETVMSTPLFLASPEDSLWTAHQEMQRRRVQRLVVSWNWGLGLGIVTQTSLLQVFDPVEMYGVIETLQYNLKAQLPGVINPQVDVDHDSLSTDGSTASPAATSKRSLSSSKTTESEIAVRLRELHDRLTHYAKQPDLGPELRQMSLNSAIADLEKICCLLPNDYADHSRSTS